MITRTIGLVLVGTLSLLGCGSDSSTSPEVPSLDRDGALSLPEDRTSVSVEDPDVLQAMYESCLAENGVLTIAGEVGLFLSPELTGESEPVLMLSQNADLAEPALEACQEIAAQIRQTSSSPEPDDPLLSEAQTAYSECMEDAGYGAELTSDGASATPPSNATDEDLALFETTSLACLAG